MSNASNYQQANSRQSIEARRIPTLALAALAGLALGAVGCSGPVDEKTEPVAAQRQATHLGDFLTLPVRWCAVEGTPLAENPASVGEATTDDALWRRHERTSEATYIPMAEVTLRSGIIDDIVFSPDLTFPIIADPVTTVGVEGDLQDPSSTDGQMELSMMLNACQEAWEERLGETMADVGFMALNIRRFVGSGGTPTGLFGVSIQDNTGVGGFGGRRVVVEDIAFTLPGSTENNATNNATFPINDHVDKTFGHEIGHAWPTVPTAGGSIGLQHTQGCPMPEVGNVNIMRQSRQDPDGDDLLNNFQLSTAVQQIIVDPATVTCTTTPCSCEEVDQIALLRGAAAAIPGCTVAESGAICSSLSDVRTDALEDVSVSALDMTMVFAGEPDGTNDTMYTHEVIGAITEYVVSAGPLDYYILADLDNDATTGGPPASLGISTSFQGAELVTRVRVFLEEPPVIGDTPPTLATIARVWRFDGASFQIVTDPSIQSRLIRQGILLDGLDGEELTTSQAKLVSIRMSNEVRGPRAATYRIQAVTYQGVTSLSAQDTLDTFIGMTPPSYPVCSASPNPSAPEGLVTVEVSGIRANESLHALLGPELVATGSSDANGNASIVFELPSGIRGGAHLITVGVDGTALTADCFVEVELPPECLHGTDVTPPGFSFVPPDVTISSCVRPGIGQAQAEDECGARVRNNAPGIFPIGTTVVTWVATDPAGNVNTAAQRVTVELGQDPSCCPAGSNVILGTPNDDVLTGTANPDCILGFGAQDTINGLGGDDFISGGDGNDVISGGAGDDFVSGGSGQDQINGNLGNDWLSGNDGTDVVRGADGDDLLSGGHGQDQLFGEAGNDRLLGEDGDDRLEGGAGNDNLVGGGIHDTCLGGGGVNTFTSCETRPDAAHAVDSCSDGVQNVDESAVDCGGVCLDCQNGLACVSGGDCQSQVCSGGICQSAASGEGNLAAQLVVTSDWGAGYCVGLSVMNPTGQPTTNWSVLLDTNQTTIVNAWNGLTSGQSGVISVTPAFSWNQVIGAGATNSSVGFCANRNVPGSGLLPFVLNASGSF